MINRTLFSALTGMFMLTSATAMADQDGDEKAKTIAANAGCFTCHTVKHQDIKDGKQPIGPAWEDVATQYKNKPGAVDFLTRIVMEGSSLYSSHWKGKVTGIAMPPNAVAISESETRQVAAWILSLK